MTADQDQPDVLHSPTPPSSLGWRIVKGFLATIVGGLAGGVGTAPLMIGLIFVDTPALGSDPISLNDVFLIGLFTFIFASPVWLAGLVIVGWPLWLFLKALRPESGPFMASALGLAAGPATIILLQQLSLAGQAWLFAGMGLLGALVARFVVFRLAYSERW